MDVATALKSARKTQRARNSLACLLAVSVLSNAAMASFIATQHSQVVLIPTVVRDGVIAAGLYDERYAEVLALDVVRAMLSVSPETRQIARDSVQRFAAPDARAGLIARFDEVTATIGERDVSTVFYPTNISHDIPGQSVLVRGELVTFLGPSRVREEERAARVQFADAGGVFRVAGIAMEALQ